ncbi:MAG: DegT/DnrJ/EryC1/StrS family aminotransferase [Chitinophagaceae bacterium]|nr:DegT/DnrJ/EryC1/StrS family aminotransferase [Chitinophagaceae bacterium]
MIDYENLGRANHVLFDEYREAFNKVLESGWYILGNAVKQFENEFAQYNQSRFCAGVANGLDALILALKTFQFEKDDEVLVPSNTYIATILSILHNQLKPVLVEPDIRTYNIDPVKIQEKITPRTKAIMVVHLYGKSCEMDTIMSIANQYHLKVVEDCAQSHGATYKNIRTGNFGHFGAFSFYPTKNLGAIGDAGALTSNDPALHENILTLRNYGSQKKYYNEQIGFNSRLDELQAALLSVKLKRLDVLTEHKRKLAKHYQQELKDDFIKPHIHSDYYDVYHIYNIRHPKRDELKEYLLRHGIKTEIHYPVAPNRQKAMIGILDRQPTPIAQEIHDTTLSLPISYFHSEADIVSIIDIMNKF